MRTRELVYALCADLGHDDAGCHVAKKLVTENWLTDVDDLRAVPRSRFEQWELPLKLIHEIEAYLLEDDVSQTTSRFQHLMNYSVRPFLNKTDLVALTVERLRDDARRRKKPELWAALKVQRAFRRRQQRRAQEKEEEIMKEVLESLCGREDFRRVTAEEARRKRRERAEERIRQAVRAWLARHRAGKTKAPHFASSSSNGVPGGLAAVVTRKACQKAKDCEMTQVIKELGRQLKQDEAELETYMYRLVTLNWLEQVADLELVEERHWDKWGLPEKLVVMLKAKLAEHTGGGFLENIIAPSETLGTAMNAAAVVAGDWSGVALELFQRGSTLLSDAAGTTAVWQFSGQSGSGSDNDNCPEADAESNSDGEP